MKNKVSLRLMWILIGVLLIINAWVLGRQYQSDLNETEREKAFAQGYMQCVRDHLSQEDFMQWKLKGSK